MADTLPAPSKRVAEFLERATASHQRGRLVFIVDATGSRERGWDSAARLQAQMFEEAAKLGGIEVQLGYFGGGGFGPAECKFSRWTSDPRELARFMTGVRCKTGLTQYRK